jgi:hypothetical protein
VTETTVDDLPDDDTDYQVEIMARDILHRLPAPAK